jgi:hypothetical protein
MGPQTRLKFRYYLEGTDELRIQIYSLSNGYHRYLSLKGLPQGEWKSATVDMTAARRPDGSGGPLSQDERIDDIQFYAVPSATIHIDEIILYDAGDETEKRPFPKDIHYTGWFDTGKQGVEWPGTFEIVEHEKPRTWKFARSVEKEAGQAQALIVSLRGARPLGKDVRLNFDYRLSGDEQPLAVELVDRESGRKRTATIPSPQRGEWTSAALELTGDASQADELHFVLRPGQQLAVDNVLLYEP